MRGAGERRLYFFEGLPRATAACERPPRRLYALYGLVVVSAAAVASVLQDASRFGRFSGHLRAKQTNKSSLVPHQLRGSALEALEHRCAVGLSLF